MAKNRDDDLFEMLRARGLRKKVASSVADAVGSGRGHGGEPPKAVKEVVADLKQLATDIEDRATGGPGKRKVAARKAAATRKRKAAERSAAARRGARTRAKTKH